jgi:hypothetical protein
MTEVKEQEILKLINQSMPYRQIMEKTGVKSTSIIAGVKKKYGIPSQPKEEKIPEKKKRPPMSLRTRQKLAKATTGAVMLRNSEIIVNDIIDILAGIKYSIHNLTDIQGNQQEKSDEVVSLLEGLREKLDEYIVNTTEITCTQDAKDLQKERNLMQKRISYALAAASDFYARDTVRIKAISELRSQFETFVSLEIVAKGIIQVKDIVRALFLATDALDDQSYANYRDRAIEINPALRRLFSEHEQDVGQSGSSEEAQVIEQPNE